MIYCPYTDRNLSEWETSAEHIIPLSLGGTNGLELPVEPALNAQLGSEIDGALANEFLFSCTVRSTMHEGIVANNPPQS